MQRDLLPTILIFLSAVFISCRDKAPVSVVEAELPQIPATTKEPLKNKTDLDLLIDEISKLERLEGKYIGSASQPSSQRDYTQELLKLEDTILLDLTNHKKPIVRFLSFKALYTKASSHIKNVLINHIQDNETYQLFAGCLITPEPVNLSMYNLIKDQLSTKERLSLGRQIKEQLTISKYWAVNLFNASI